MSEFSRAARILALEALLAHFPNPFLVARGIERTYGSKLARALPQQLNRLRVELKAELRSLQSKQTLR